jgi:hypothetical protein
MHRSREKSTIVARESHLRTTIDKAENADAKSAHLSDLFFRAVERAGGANEYPGNNCASSIKAMMRVYNQRTDPERMIFFHPYPVLCCPLFFQWGCALVYFLTLPVY